MNLLNNSKINNSYKGVFLLIFLLFTLIFDGFSQLKPFTVVLDAGHGGKDPGKVSNHKYYEKEIALNIVLEVGKLLEQEKNIKVIYTRKTDIFLELRERARIANKADADLFVSIHCNAHHSQAEGAETWILGLHANKANFEIAKAENSVILLEDNYEMNYKGFDPNSPESFIGLTLMQEEYLDQSIALASFIQDNFTNELKRTNRGVKQAGFWVLHNTYMPSVLIETGFITNNNEGAFLNSADGQIKFSQSIASSILKYHKNQSINSTNNNGKAILTSKESAIKTDNKSSSKSVIDETPVNSEPVKNEVIIKDEIVYKVQIAASSKKIATESYNFNGLENVTTMLEGNLYKYYAGISSDESEVKKYLQIARAKGYNQAFIVAFKNGIKITYNP
ncbi:MAG: N-acetylmuramoyl-L-alanine amidase [Flavobacteriaceae bacterium]|nr:N-acetylmuramoyl-L-alanine amidase [Flavobacteriaceae bacterium]